MTASPNASYGDEFVECVVDLSVKSFLNISKVRTMHVLRIYCLTQISNQPVTAHQNTPITSNHDQFLATGKLSTSLLDEVKQSKHHDQYMYIQMTAWLTWLNRETNDLTFIYLICFVRKISNKGSHLQLGSPPFRKLYLQAHIQCMQPLNTCSQMRMHSVMKTITLGPREGFLKQSCILPLKPHGY